MRCATKCGIYWSYEQVKHIDVEQQNRVKLETVVLRLARIEGKMERIALKMEQINPERKVEQGSKP